MMTLPDYFDYMATTPVDPWVFEQMLPYLAGMQGIGNPASVTHWYGQHALKAVEHAREQVALTIGASPSEIVFTSGATEANNLALLGAARLYQRKGKHIITMQTEHQAVLGPLAQLEREGFSVTYLAPQPDGLLALEHVKSALTAQTILVSVMHVNNEIGVIQPISDLAQLLTGRGILLHVDCAQSVGKIPVQVDTLGADLLAMSAHKNYGPKGVGALYIRAQPRVRVLPIAFGGGQERGLRPGTLATHQIVGMGAAFELGECCRLADYARILMLRQQLWDGIAHLPGVRLNGHPTERVAGNLNVSFAGVQQDLLLPSLPELALSSGSACSAASQHPSYVLKALGLSDALCLGALRFSLGRYSTEEAVTRAIGLLSAVILKSGEN
ncbi:MAG: aminotransferase class V-fold PLP-dependent enzyme [Gammaproteobacteria bacterium]|nr:aminotransferase class V-fold PLP-dependent enzyme [Gammaproteobacteria bacterium]